MSSGLRERLTTRQSRRSTGSLLRATLVPAIRHMREVAVAEQLQAQVAEAAGGGAGGLHASRTAKNRGELGV